LTEAQRAICRVAVTFDRDLLQRRSYVTVIPEPPFDITQEFRPWVKEEFIEKLRGFWLGYNDEVNKTICGTKTLTEHIGIVIGD
jgi:hypothetical protein